MFRTAALRSAAQVAVRPVVARAAIRRTVAVAAPRVQISQRLSAAPGWTAVRCYASGGGLKKEEVEGRIIALLQGFDKVNDPSNIKPTAHFANDLGLDSLDTVEVVMAIEEEFSIEIPDKDADAIHSIDKAVEYIVAQPGAN